jgi:hypothetical protein
LLGAAGLTDILDEHCDDRAAQALALDALARTWWQRTRAALRLHESGPPVAQPTPGAALAG